MPLWMNGMLLVRVLHAQLVSMLNWMRNAFLAVLLVGAVPLFGAGKWIRGSIDDSKIYPGTTNAFQVYLPSAYDGTKPACVLLKLDGIGDYEVQVIERLIAAKELPVIVAVGISPGVISRNGAVVRYNRSFEFDSMNDDFPNYVLDELLPEIERLGVRISHDAKDRMVMGASTGGIGAWTLAWRRPDQFSRVYSEIGTFVSMRGGNQYPALIRKTEPKPIRVFLEDGTEDAWNPLFGSWYEANLLMFSALEFAGYDVNHSWSVHGHDARPGQALLPDVLRWLWRDYPAPVATGISKNSTLVEITNPGSGWEFLPENQDSGARGLAVDPSGKLTVDNSGIAFGPDGKLFHSKGHILVREDGSVYESVGGIVTRTVNGKKQVLESTLPTASGIAFSPDKKLFFVADAGSQWVYSYVVEADGSMSDRQRFYWLHMTDIPNNSGARDLATDTHGNLYVATRMGIQVCDQNGRVRAILPLPAPGLPVQALAISKKYLFATDGKRVFRRKIKVDGIPQWAQPIAYERIGPG
jgi:gluconolactonase